MAMVDTAAAHDVSRRRFLARVTNGIIGIIGAAVAYITGRAALSSIAGAQANWLPASSILELKDNEPTPVTLTVSRLDGFREVIDKKTIFLVKTGDAQVAAMDSTCSHLGCLVTWKERTERLALFMPPERVAIALKASRNPKAREFAKEDWYWRKTAIRFARPWLPLSADLATAAAYDEGVVLYDEGLEALEPPEGDE